MPEAGHEEQEAHTRVALRDAGHGEDADSEVRAEENREGSVCFRGLHQLLGAKFVLFGPRQTRPGAADSWGGEA